MSQRSMTCTEICSSNVNHMVVKNGQIDEGSHSETAISVSWKARVSVQAAHR